MQQIGCNFVGSNDISEIIKMMITVSIGVHSDIRLNPNLSCKYSICFNKLPIFLKELLNKNLQFSDSLANL
jgi:hypothetical protein